LLLGVGGAGRVAALKLAAEGLSELFLINRTIAKAEALAREISSRFPEGKSHRRLSKDSHSSGCERHPAGSQGQR